MLKDFRSDSRVVEYEISKAGNIYRYFTSALDMPASKEDPLRLECN